MKVLDYLSTKVEHLEENQTVALSNDVYVVDNYFYKKYAINPFKDAFGNQDLIFHLALETTEFFNKFKVFEDGIATRRIDGIMLNRDSIQVNQIKLLVSKIYNFHHLPNKDFIATPGFFRAFKFFKTLDYVDVILPEEDEIIKQAKAKAFENIVLSHNDLIPQNIIFLKDLESGVINNLKFIDFEYGGFINYHFDIASTINSWALNYDKEKILIDEFKKYYEIDEEYLKIVRKTLYIFWAKLCDFKYRETGREEFKIIKDAIKKILKSNLISDVAYI